MEHKHYEELLQLYVHGELEQKERTDYERHIQSCSQCQRELEEWNNLNAVLDKYEPIPADEALLSEARQELTQILNTRVEKRHLWDNLKEYFSNIFPSYKVAVGGATLIAIGFLVGYLFTQSTKYELPSTTVSANNTTNFGEPLSSSPRISNVRFIDSDDADGEVEFTFDAVMPVRMKGRVDDPNVQKVLAHALLSDLNPGVRLQSVSALTSELNPPQLEDELMDALISAVRFDKNPGVRQVAMQALQQYRKDPKVRQALLDVLVRDQTAGLRIAAINILTTWNGESIRGDSALIQVLKTKLINDSNNYIRMRSHAVLKEILP